MHEVHIFLIPEYNIVDDGMYWEKIEKDFCLFLLKDKVILQFLLETKRRRFGTPRINKCISQKTRGIASENIRCSNYRVMNI